MHIGTITTDMPQEDPDSYSTSGYAIDRVIRAPQGVSGPHLQIDVELADGDLDVVRN